MIVGPRDFDAGDCRPCARSTAPIEAWLRYGSVRRRRTGPCSSCRRRGLPALGDRWRRDRADHGGPDRAGRVHHAQGGARASRGRRASRRSSTRPRSCCRCSSSGSRSSESGSSGRSRGRVDPQRGPAARRDRVLHDPRADPRVGRRAEPRHDGGRDRVREEGHLGLGGEGVQLPLRAAARGAPLRRAALRTSSGSCRACCSTARACGVHVANLLVPFWQNRGVRDDRAAARTADLEGLRRSPRCSMPRSSGSWTP